jgi:signal transduction histidine kinase
LNELDEDIRLGPSTGSIVQAAIRLEGGTLTLANRPEGGLVAAIRLPLAQS